MKDSKSKSAQEVDNLDEYAPAETRGDEGRSYQNYSNNYGSGRPQRTEHPRQIVQGESTEHGGRPAREKREKGGKSRARGCCCGCAVVAAILVVLVIAVVLYVGSLMEMPVSEDSIGPRKDQTATILICGTDKDGTRTDTMMLLYLDGKEERIGLLSLPRDTLTITDSGKRAKLNSAYGRNGCGEQGMEWTMNYVQRIIGYRPDGYILVDMELVPQMVDLMGGVNVHLDHHIRVHTDGVEVYVPAGDQHLNGEEVLATLRYRYGYYNADLGRVEVQRMVIKECMKQWISPMKLGKLPDALELIEQESLTDLDFGNYLWIGKVILQGMDDMTSHTLPGYPDMRGGASYYVLYPEKVAELINEFYNPYTVDIDVDDLNIAE